jgi:hypothetical protein
VARRAELEKVERWLRGEHRRALPDWPTVTIEVRRRAARHSVGEQRRSEEITNKRGKERQNREWFEEATMKVTYEAKNVRCGLKKAMRIGVAGMIVGALTLAPLAAAGGVREEDRIVNERTINRAEVENLQRWVSSGHADWCKDARLVAAEELWRLAPEYSGDGFELNTIANDGNRVTFEWAPIDGRALYRVTVERFDWLLPIARDTEGMVWVPTSTEIRTHE